MMRKKAMVEKKELIYTGKAKETKNPYIAGEGLVEAVNLAIYLDRPLLLQGEPGCGKTLLAKAITEEWSQKYLREWPFYSWVIKSSSRAKDGLYTYDSVKRFQDAQLLGLLGSDRLNDYLDLKEANKLMGRLKDPGSYIKYGSLGQAFLEEKCPAVVLIDEIDKADLDFPNDLLEELEEKQFSIPEISKVVKARQSPLIIITSNRERTLPEAFLRRCIYYYIDFPEEEQLLEIVSAHVKVNFPNLTVEELKAKAINKFVAVREKMKIKINSKPPSTSELLDWLKILLQQPDMDLTESDLDKLAQKHSGVLIKNKEDLEFFLYDQ